MLSMGMDLDAVVNDSYGFLSDIDSGTMQRRKPVSLQIQSWDDRNNSRPQRNINQWESQVGRPSGPRTPDGSETYVQGEEGQRYRQKEPSLMRPPHPERNAHNKGPSSLLRRTNDMPSKPVQQRREEPLYQVPQTGTRNGQSLISQQSYYGPSRPEQIEPPRRGEFQRPPLIERDKAWSIKSQDRGVSPSASRYPERAYYETRMSEGGQSVLWQGSVGDVRHLRGQNPPDRRNGELLTGISRDLRYDGQVNAQNSRRLERHDSESFGQHENIRGLKPIYSESVRRPTDEEYRGEFNKSEIYLKSPGGKSTADSSRALNSSDERSKPTREDLNQPKIKGSYLLQRTNTYLEAVESFKNRNAGGKIIEESEGMTRFNEGAIPVPPPRVPRDAKFPELKRVGSTNKVNQRLSENRMSKEITDRNRSSIPPPPAPPMPPPMPPNRVDSIKPTAVNAAATKQPMAPPPWLEDLKKGRRELRRVPSLKRIEVEPEPEPKTFKEKLERIVQKQAAAQRWQLARPVSKKSEEGDEDHEVVVGSEPYKTVKTLSKSAMKNKLEKILVKGPPNRPSFKGAFDMDDKRKDAVARLRAIEKEALQRQWATEEHDDFPNDSAAVPSVPVKRSPSVEKGAVGEEPIVNRQRMLMGDVVATIKLKGAKSSFSYT